MRTHHHPSRPARRASLLLVGSCFALLAASVPAHAAQPPVGKTYYTVFVGLAESYGLSADCFVFGASELCSTDGEICGSWIRTSRDGKQTGFSFDLSFQDAGRTVRVEGHARLEPVGRKSSLGGSGRITGAGPRFNYAFAAREVGAARCQELLGNSPAAVGDTPIQGSGDYETESREISGVEGVALNGVGRLRIRHGSEESLTVTADDNLLPRIVTEVRNGLLILGFEAGYSFSTDREIFFDLTVVRLDSITVSGVGTVSARGIDTDRLRIDVSGVASIDAAGRADRQEVSVSGVGGYFARDLETRVTEVDLSGTSKAVVRVSERLTGSVSGVSTLEYLGNPTVEVEVSGASKVSKID